MLLRHKDYTGEEGWSFRVTRYRVHTYIVHIVQLYLNIGLSGAKTAVLVEVLLVGPIIISYIAAYRWYSMLNKREIWVKPNVISIVSIYVSESFHHRKVLLFQTINAQKKKWKNSI